MSDKMQCELISWHRVEVLCHQLALQIEQQAYKPRIIIAIGRGGYVPARLLADYLDMMALSSIKVEHYLGARKSKQAVIKYPLNVDINGLEVLLVDDVSDSGDTFEVAIDHLQQHWQPRTIKTVVLHHKTSSRYVPDYYAAKVIKWRWLIYPWARVEDISGFITDMPPELDSVTAVAAQLHKDYGITVSDRLLHYILQHTPQQRD